MNSQQEENQQKMGRRARSGLSIDLSVKLDLSEDLQAIRRKAVDAQRYDVPTKRAPGLPECDQRVNSDMVYIGHATVARADTIRPDYECYTLPLNPPPTPACHPHAHGLDVSELMDYLGSTLGFPFEVEISVDAEKRADMKYQQGTGCLTETNDFERDGYTLTRTIIRPVKQPVLGIFLQRPLCGLNCRSCGKAFEKDLDGISDLRKKELRGEADIQVFNSEHRNIDVGV